MSLVMARTSVELSENILRCVTSLFTAERIADRRARASAISGDPMESWILEPWMIIVPAESVKFHASPARCDLLSKAASDLPIVSTAGDTEARGGLWRRGGVFFVAFFLSCAIFHSLANLIPLVATSIADRVLFSKIARFLAVQIAQQIHGRMLFETPVGGRQTACRKATIASLKLLPVAR